MLTYWDIKHKLANISRLDLLSATAVGKNDIFMNFVADLKPKNVIEIGTYNGISTALMASIAEHVYTFDIAYRDAEFVLNLFGLRHKVSIIVASQKEIDFQIGCISNKDTSYWRDNIVFDFAFVDGAHDYQSTKHDFELVSFTGRVLFHNADWPPVRKFINEIGAKTIGKKGNWGYWDAGYNN